jgi:hypothetical protein
VSVCLLLFYLDSTGCITTNKIPTCFFRVGRAPQDDSCLAGVAFCSKLDICVENLQNIKVPVITFLPILTGSINSF